MKLRLPHNFLAALMAALAPVAFTTLSTASLGAAFFLGSQTFAEDAAEEPASTEAGDETSEFDSGYADLSAAPEKSDEQQKIEVDQANIKTIEVGSKGGAGNNDGLLVNEDEYNDIDETALDAVASGNPASTTSGTADTIPADDLGFTSNSYDTGAEAFDGSDEGSQMPAAPAVQLVQEKTPTQKNNSTDTTSTQSKSLLSTGGISLGGGLGSFGSVGSLGTINTPVTTTATKNSDTPALAALDDANDSVGQQVQASESLITTTFSQTGTGAHQWTANVSTEYYLSTTSWSLTKDGETNALGNKSNQNQLRPDTNVQTDKGWVLSFDITNTVSAEVTLTGITINSFLFDSNNGYQSVKTERKFDISLADGDFLNEYTITSNGGDNPDSGIITLNFTNAVTLSQNDTKHISLTVAKGDENTGCYVGLTRLVVNGSVQLPSYIWAAETDGSAWTDSVWEKGGQTEQNFASGSDAVFDSTATSTQVNITSEVTAHNVSVSGQDYTFNVQNGGSLTATTIRVTGGSQTIALEGSTLTANSVSVAGDGSSLQVTGAGTLNVSTIEGTLTVAPSARNTVTMNNVLSGTGALVVEGGGTLQLNGANTFSGGITVTGATVEMGNKSALGAETNTITIAQGGVIDLKGTGDVCYSYTLQGGTLQNTGSSTSTSHKQTKGLTLTKNSTIGGTGNFYVLNNSYNAATVDLGGFKLTKTGSNTVGFYTVTFTNGGTMEVQGGALAFTVNDKGTNTIAGNTTLALNVENSGNTDRASGKLNVGTADAAATLTVDAQKSATISLAAALQNAGSSLIAKVADEQTLTMRGVISGNGGLTKDGGGTLTLYGNNTYTGTTTVNAGTLDLTEAMTTGSLSVGNEATLKLATEGKLLTVDGNLNLDSGSVLDVSRLDNQYQAGTEITLVTYTGTVSSSGVILTGLTPGHSAYLTNNETDKRLILTFIDTLNWDGSNDNHTWVNGSGDAWEDRTVFHNGASVSFSSSTAKKEVLIQSAIVAGTVTVSEDGYCFVMSNGGSLTADNLYIADGKTLTTTGNLTIHNAMGGEGNNGNLTYDGDGSGTITFQSNDGEHVKEYTGTFTNESKDEVTLRFPESTQSKSFEIHFDIERAKGAGVVNLDLLKGTTTQSEADLSVFSSSVEVNDIKHSSNVTVLVRDQGSLTVTGTVTTGRLVVGQANTETDAVFTLAGTNAKLNKGGTGSTFDAPVQGYGTLALTEGATETLSGTLTDFHGTYEVSGENSVLTLSSAVASDAKLVVKDGGVINLTATYTMGDNSSVDGGTISVGNGLVVDGTVDLSKGTLAQTGGTVTVNQGKSLTLGNASITSAIANSGTVTFTKDITATGLAEASEQYSVGADDEKSTNGNYFYQGKRTEGTLTVVIGGGTLTTGGIKVTQGNHEYTLKADGTATCVTADEVDYRTFLLSTETAPALSVSQIATTSTKHGMELHEVRVSNEAALSMDAGIAKVTLDTGTLNISNGAAIGEKLFLSSGFNAVNGAIDTSKISVSDTAFQQTGFSGAPFQAGGVSYSAASADLPVFVASNAVEGAQANDETVYSISSNRFRVTAALLEKTSGGDVTVGNELNVNRVRNIAENASGKLTLSSGAAAAKLKEVSATSGYIEFYNMSATDQANLDTLNIGKDMAVSMYKGSVAEAAQEASVTVTGTLTAGAGAKLNANVDMASGSHLDVSGAQSTKGLLMGSDVTLHSGSYLDIAGYAQDQVSGYLYNYLASGEDKLYYLYSGTDNDKINLSINGTQQIDPLTKRSWNDYDMDASTIYANLQAQTFYLVYDGANVGTIVAIGLVPEPTTSTLSLLALIALAARRRRK